MAEEIRNIENDEIDEILENICLTKGKKDVYFLKPMFEIWIIALKSCLTNAKYFNSFN